MSVVLTNMDMPNSCSECRLKTRCEYALANGWLNNKRDDKCPLKPYEERKGKWIKHDTYYDCSLCSELAKCTETADTFVWKLSKFCPGCGAKMEE